ncbi:hypothetical protein G6F46_014981 [Rhizopus delemar]|nr:hypothetical protein G6F22_021959 [Rhizopus arrhizus]KAG1239008.1 hypothetical protein G6F68_018728 [Rhizopus microsporus]KAG1584409.1 hypothetical protein G6F46_014981 [Rhizopus delemar]
MPTRHDQRSPASGLRPCSRTRDAERRTRRLGSAVRPEPRSLRLPSGTCAVPFRTTCVQTGTAVRHGRSRRCRRHARGGR